MKRLILLLILSIYATLALSEEQTYESFPVHEFAKSPLRDLKIPQNWQLCNDVSELDRFHDEYKAPVNEDELIFAWRMIDLINDCERIISEFDLYALDKLPKNSCRVRIRNRCGISGRPHGYYRKLKISRIALRDMASAGKIPGIIKSSW